MPSSQPKSASSINVHSLKLRTAFLPLNLIGYMYFGEIPYRYSPCHQLFCQVLMVNIFAGSSPVARHRKHRPISAISGQKARSIRPDFQAPGMLAHFLYHTELSDLVSVPNVFDGKKTCLPRNTQKTRKKNILKNMCYLASFRPFSCLLCVSW